MPTASQKDLQAQTENLAKLIKSEVGGLRTEMKSEIGGLRTEFKADLSKEIGSVRSELSKEIGSVRSDMKKQFAFQRQELVSYLDDKFETNRRLMVDDMQNFQDAIITEVKAIKQETIVNSSHRVTLTDHETRLSKVERHLFSN